MNCFKLIVGVVVVLMCPFTVYASGPAPYATITVKGMVCSFCVQGVEKKLMELKGVEKVTVNLKKKTVLVWTAKNASLSDLDMRNAIQSAGYNIESILRQETSPKVRSRIDRTASPIFSR